MSREDVDFLRKSGIVTIGEAGSGKTTSPSGPRALRPAPDVIARRIDNGTVLIELKTNKIYELNATGTRIWEMLGAGATVAEMQAGLQREFEVEAAEAARAIEETLARLSDEGLVQVR